MAVNPLNWQVPMVNKDGTPTNEFMRKWLQQGGVNSGIPIGANPTATASDTAVNGTAATFMRSDAAPAVQKTSSTQFGLAKVDGTTITAAGGVISGTAAVTGANPTATASDTAVNGTAATFMRSDAAPAVQKTSSTQFGLAKVDGVSIFSASGILSGTGFGLAPGTPPTIVQSAASTAASNSITLAAAPVSGNLLVAICSSSSTAIGAGWTSASSNGGGIDFSFIVTKVAGPSESATQTPIGASSPADATIAMWELSGQSSSPVVFASATVVVSSTFPSTAVFPSLANAIALAAINTDGGSTATISNLVNMTRDSLINTGIRHVVSGHSNASIPLASAECTFTPAQAARSGIIVVLGNAGTPPTPSFNIPLADGMVFVGNSLGSATGVAVSGDATIADTGAVTVTKSSGVAFRSAAFQETTAFDAAGLAIGTAKKLAWIGI